jgi:hypothetical protein
MRSDELGGPTKAELGAPGDSGSMGTAVFVLNDRVQNGTVELREVDLFGGTSTGTSGANYGFEKGAKIERKPRWKFRSK